MRKVSALSHTESTEIAECAFFPASLLERKRLAEQTFSHAQSQGFGKWTLRPLRALPDTTAPRRSFSDGAFTLIELLTVMAIIAVLAGLTLGLFGYANRRSVESRTRAEIKALEVAIEAYKLDKGVYPPSASTTRGTTAAAIANSKALYKALSGNSAGTGLAPDSTNRSYFTAFSDAKTGNVTLDSGTYYVADPNRNAYNYITGSPSVQTNKVTFDLWSFGIDGVNDTTDDIANWRF